MMKKGKSEGREGGREGGRAARTWYMGPAGATMDMMSLRPP